MERNDGLMYDMIVYFDTENTKANPLKLGIKSNPDIYEAHPLLLPFFYEYKFRQQDGRYRAWFYGDFDLWQQAATEFRDLAFATSELTQDNKNEKWILIFENVEPYTFTDEELAEELDENGTPEPDDEGDEESDESGEGGAPRDEEGGNRDGDKEGKGGGQKQTETTGEGSCDVAGESDENGENSAENTENTEGGYEPKKQHQNSQNGAIDRRFESNGGSRRRLRRDEYNPNASFGYFHQKTVGKHEILHFDSFARFTDFTNKQMSRLSQGNKDEYKAFLTRMERRLADTKTNKHFFGDPLPQSVKEILDTKKYLHMDEYRKVKAAVASKLRRLEPDVFASLHQKRLEYNDLGMGVFVFSRAAMGLMKQKDADGNERIVSNFEKSYAYRQPRIVNDRLIRFVCVTSGISANVKADELIYNAIPTIILTEYLMELGFEVEVYVIDGEESEHISTVVKMKNAGGELNKNDLLLAMSEPRYVRGAGDKAKFAYMNHYKRICPEELGYSPTWGQDWQAAETILKDGDDRNSIFMQYQTHSFDEAIDSIFNTLNTLKRRFQSK